MGLQLSAEKYRSKSYEYHIEYNDWWAGQMKHIVWLEVHNEDCDTHQMDGDMDWDE